MSKQIKKAANVLQASTVYIDDESECEHGDLAKQPVHIQIHQLDKDKLKIEGIAYRNPNNRLETQILSLLASLS